MKFKTLFLLLTMLLFSFASTTFEACSSDVGSYDGNDSTSSGDTDTDSDSDTDSDTDTDTDTDGDSDTVNYNNVWGAVYAVHDNGYVSFDNFAGWAQPVIDELGTTVVPQNFNSISEGGTLCISGTLAPTIDGYAMIQYNLNQPMTDDGTPVAVTPTGDGLLIKFNNSIPTSPLKIQLQGLDFETNPEHSWCANIIPNTKSVAWSDFTTTCWDKAGIEYNYEPISSISVVSPGADNVDRPYDYCVNSLQLYTDTTDTDVDTSPVIGEGTLCSNTQKLRVTKDGVSYLVMNNVWNPGSSVNPQCIDVYSTTFKVTKQNASSGSSAPVSYPSVMYGGKSSSEISTDSVLPKLVSSLGAVNTVWNQNAGIASGTYNASYDVWFNKSATFPASAPDGAYLMIWPYKQGSIVPAGSGGASVTIAGKSWTVWSGGTGPTKAPYIAYVLNSGNSNLSFSLKDFINDAKSRGVVNDSMYLANVQAGFEIWSGGVGLATTDFSVSDF